MPPRFFFDRNVPAAAVRALKCVRDDVVGHGELFAPDATDEHIVREIAPLGLVMITRDRNMARRPRQRRVLLETGIFVFCNSDGGNLSTWDFFELLVRRWTAIEAKILVEPPGIYFYSRAQQPHLRWS